ncbi:MAG: response regulator transcription factor [Chlorobiaceae bacterium]|nr:response regulator transcription factor [Chlorobiaceae bacterium]
MAEKKKIIVVEDECDFRESLVEYLTLAGFDVTGTASALEFYQSIAQQQFPLVILDIGLPDQSGLVLAEYIRKNTDMRIVMLTAQSSLDSKITAYRSGADLYLIKPIDFAELTASLNSILGRLETSYSITRELIHNEQEASPPKLTQWVLLRKDCTLFTPNGDKTTLTSKEFDLLDKLALTPNTLVERQTLLKTLDYDNDDLGNRALDALIHRLRRKKKELDFRIPIKTFHGSGYSFLAPIIVK